MNNLKIMILSFNENEKKYKTCNPDFANYVIGVRPDIVVISTQASNYLSEFHKSFVNCFSKTYTRLSTTDFTTFLSSDIKTSIFIDNKIVGNLKTGNKPINYLIDKKMNVGK